MLQAHIGCYVVDDVLPCYCFLIIMRYKCSHISGVSCESRIYIRFLSHPRDAGQLFKIRLPRRV